LGDRARPRRAERTGGTGGAPNVGLTEWRWIVPTGINAEAL